MSFILLVNILLFEEDCQALQKEPFRNTCDEKGVPRPFKQGNAILQFMLKIPKQADLTPTII